jgi:hypothetical protein
MDKALANKLMVTAGSVLFVNGGLLLFAPHRFGRLRKSSWTPRAVDSTIDWATDDDRRGRTVGVVALLLGLTLLVIGTMRTRPE